jgi:hypothetical protein
MRPLLLSGIISLLMLSGCSKDPDDGSNLPNISIRGIISEGSQKGSVLKSVDEGSLSDADKVLVFNSTGYRLFDIENGTFNAYALSGTATAIAFLDADNRFIGCLSSGGLNVLPLVSLRDGDQTIIDLGNLSLDGTRVIPVNNPIGNEINLSENEISRYIALGSYYESLSQNMDADQDGIPDLLGKKEFNISTVFDLYCGSYGLNTTPPQVNDTTSFFVNYAIRIAGGKSIIPVNTNLNFSGPEGSPYSDIRQEGYSPAPDGFISAFVRQSPPPANYPFQSLHLPFMEGKYTITLDNKSYALHYSNINARYFFILALPTIHTNDQNQIVSVSVEYRDMNHDLVNAENFVYQTQATLYGNQTILSSMGALWENPEAKTNTEIYNFILPDPVSLSELQGVSVMYVDLIGNSYRLEFRPMAGIR